MCIIELTKVIPKHRPTPFNEIVKEKIYNAHSKASPSRLIHTRFSEPRRTTRFVFVVL